MAAFPLLRTGAVTQYPFTGTTAHSVQVLRYVDGSEQRFRVAPVVRRWAVHLEAVSEAEAAELERFFETMQGQFGTFSFTDPFDGNEYAECCLEDSHLDLELREEGFAGATLTVRTC